MIHCPKCGSAHIHASSRTYLGDMLQRSMGKTPFRCYRCEHRFFSLGSLAQDSKRSTPPSSIWFFLRLRKRTQKKLLLYLLFILFTIACFAFFAFMLSRLNENTEEDSSSTESTVRMAPFPGHIEKIATIIARQTHSDFAFATTLRKTVLQ